MEFKYYYCPCCGKIIMSLNDIPNNCIFCNTLMLNTPYTTKEWESKTLDEQENYKTQIRETLVKTNSLYNKEKYKAREYDEKHIKIGENQYQPHCPICGSQNIEKISTGSKVGKAALLGVFSLGTIGKTYKCKSCGAKF